MPLAEADAKALDQGLRLYTRGQLAELASCDPSTVHRALVDPDSPLRYTHQRGRRKFIEHAVATAWLDSLRIGDE